ncbi:MAG: hypothetical protein RR547_06630 [Raoultibacter sp.]
MANSEVRIVLAQGNEVVLATDNPNVESLVCKIVELKDTLNVDSIFVKCELEGFDSISFTEVVKESSRQFLETLRLEHDKYEQAMSNILAESQSSS